MVDHLGDEFDFRILTSDRDLGDTLPYPHVTPGTWTPQGKAHVMYLSPSQQRLGAWHRLLQEVPYDILYLNSFFSTFTRKTLFWRRLGALPDRPIILAPRGEFSEGALHLKSYKKRAYLTLAGRLGLYRHLLWQASSEYEVQDILRTVSRYHLDFNPTVVIAPNLFPKFSGQLRFTDVQKKGGAAHFIFLSRITQKKNLKFTLQILKKIRGDIQFDIYGPLEDAGYWRSCQAIIAQLPDRITVRYHGPVSPDSVSGIFSRYHAFLFPTLGENFGHVILESLTAGCPVVISDRTPWRNLARKYAGWDLPLEQPVSFQETIQQLVDMDQKTWKTWSEGARKTAEAFIYDPAIVEANRQLFYTALAKK